ncbi:MAG: hypothetical protein C0469_06755 [Cyanobacteria bacterium DS2.3.42]|nr:hypothetical protein [Cyanobacteria bacterium DS2.3.42]
MSTESDPNAVLRELENAKQVYSGGNYAAAEPLLREVCEKIAHLPDEMAYCTECLSEIYTAWGKFSEAIKLNQRLINVTASNPAVSLNAIGGALERIGAISLKVGKQEQSEKLTRLAAAVKAGKIDVATLVTDKAKIPMAPPTTEHTFTFRAVAPDAPAPPGMETAGGQTQGFAAPAPAPPPVSPPVPPLPAPPKPSAPAPDPLGKPIKETAMFSRPNISAVNNVAPNVPPSMPNVPPAVLKIPPNINNADIPAHQLADFDEEVSVDPAYLSGSHAPVSEAQPEIPADNSEGVIDSDSWGPPPEDFLESVAETQSPVVEQSAETQATPLAQYPTPHTPDAQLAAPQFSAPSAAQQVQFPAQPSAAPAFESPSPAAQAIPDSGSPLASSSHSETHAEEPVHLQNESSSSHAASSMRSMRSMSSRNMAAPPVVSGPDMGGVMGMFASFFVGKRNPDQPVQQLEDPGSSSARAAGVLVLIAALVLGGIYAAYNLTPRKLTAEQAFLATQHKYVTADSAETFTLVDASSCEFAIGDAKMKTALRFYLDDWRDAVDMALGRAGQKHFWMYKHDDCIVDQDETKFYLHGGPEIQIANKVEILSQYAGVYFQRTRKYPERNDSNGAADLSYQNPYTKKREVPSFHRIVVGKGISASLDADGARTKFYEELLLGVIPKDTPKAHPGEIRCYVVDFLSPRGTIQGFVVQLIGKDGKPVNGSRPGTSYVFALEDGKEYKPTQPPQLPFKGNPGLRPVTVWLLMDKLDPTFVLVLTAGPAIVFTALSFFFLIVTFAIPKGLGRFVAIILLVSCAIPALLFVLVKVMP